MFGGSAIVIVIAIIAAICVHEWKSLENLAWPSLSSFQRNNITYYSSINLSASGKTLKRSLHTLIRRQRVLTYKEVWDALEDIDQADCPHGKVHDIYSGRCWRASIDRCGKGGVTAEGQCFNREHAWPKSW
jgi:hypothetical protein